ncbi:hypothetical protein AAC387_Pa10g0997 [Persea americana]
MTNKLLAVHVIQWEALNSHFKLVELNHTLVIAERQLTEASEVLQRLRVRQRDRNGYVVWLAIVEDQEREMFNQMDGLLGSADGLCISGSSSRTISRSWC